ncbi:MAG: hydrogenase expression/formation protein HypE [Candidatus Woesearchaeota archaeon]|nr:hydrogenase expression/formation protein HypE [Nanoarchaeota archaeon]USN44313.1 MAG: hydrogenase expression/formation protein HypE [Candidatus Woesearchaeota archaeon]
MEEKKTISLDFGNGGLEMQEFIEKFSRGFFKNDKWTNHDEDAAVFKEEASPKLCFTTDSYIASPAFFPGGNIGKLAICGTLNDLVVAGARPIGLSLSFILEEGFPMEDFDKIILSLQEESTKAGVPIVTGDTKVMERGSLDGIVINTAGLGFLEYERDGEIEEGDSIIVSGGIGEHAVALLSKRFEFETTLLTDSKYVGEEMKEIGGKVRLAKDPTRGGLAACLNEIAKKYSLSLEIEETQIPLKKEVRAATKLLGIDPYTLACEGRLICIVSKDKEKEVLTTLKTYNTEAAVIGKVTKKREKGFQVEIKTKLGRRFLPTPSGKIVPRIC